MNQIRFGKSIIKYSVIKTKRAKTSQIVVDRDNVIVRTPLSKSKSEIQDIVKEISTIIPIKIETKKIKITIPAVHTGKVYGLINQYKEEENWLSNGDLEVTLKIPSGIIMDFYDKLNSMTHGSALTEEIKEK